MSKRRPLVASIEQHREIQARISLENSIVPRKPKLVTDPWKRLSAAVPRRYLTGIDSLYAIPLNLIDAIQEFTKGFLSTNDVQFERQLAKISRGGFFQRRCFRYPEHLLGEDFSALEDDPDILRANETLRILEPLPPEDGAELERVKRRRAEFVARWATGYVGWLVTNDTFRAEVAAFRRKWNSRIEQSGFPPGLRKHLAWVEHGGGKARIGKSRISAEDKSFAWQFQQLQDRWCLKSMLTWDLPLPMEADFDSPFMYDPFEVSRAGILILLPWYLLRQKSIPVRELGVGVKALQMPKTLDQWFSQRGGLGEKRYGTLCRLYVYRELALASRYRKQIGGHVEGLDRAFSEFLQEGEEGTETVKKLRLMLKRSLSSMNAGDTLPRRTSAP